MSLSIFSAHLYSERAFPNHISNFKLESAKYILQITEAPLEKTNSYKSEVSLLKAEIEDTVTLVSGKAILYFQKSKASSKLRYGDVIVFNGQLSELSGPKNPYEFNYKRYLSLKSIYHQAYADSSSWLRLDYSPSNPILKWSITLRQKLTQQIDSWDLSKDEKSISKALLMGYRFDIEDDLLQAYSSAGAMHVLAVSGLHVGIVYLVLLFLLRPLAKYKAGKKIRTIILIIALWVYALLTGLSPSVVRAATMFSFVAFALIYNRQTSVYNTLLASAILLLLIKPTYLFEVGFQLSYLAVAGIVWLQPKFRSFWYPPNWLLRQIWDITTVSLAAQIATFPLGLYYFHQFPSLFLVSNLMVIPLVILLMYVGLPTLILSSFGIVFDFLIKVYGWLLSLMNTCVLVVESWSSFLIDQIHISTIETVLIYTSLFFIFSWMFYGQRYRLLTGLTLFVCLQLFQMLENYSHQNQKVLTVYAIKNHSVLELSKGKQSSFIADDELDDKTLSYHVKPNWWANNTQNIHRISWEDDFQNQFSAKQNELLTFCHLIIWAPKTIVSTVPTANIWLIQNRDIHPPLEQKDNLPKQIIICSKTSFYHQKEWKNWCTQNGIEFINVLETGAYQLFI